MFTPDGREFFFSRRIDGVFAMYRSVRGNAGWSTMILTSTRPGGFGNADLYVAFRERDRTWSKPVNLGETINSDQIDFCPMMTPDGRYLFFSRRWGATWEQTTQADVYWVDARVIEQFRPVAGRQ